MLTISKDHIFDQFFKKSEKFLDVISNVASPLILLLSWLLVLLDILTLHFLMLNLSFYFIFSISLSLCVAFGINSSHLIFIQLFFIQMWLFFQFEPAIGLLISLPLFLISVSFIFFFKSTHPFRYCFVHFPCF